MCVVVILVFTHFALKESLFDCLNHCLMSVPNDSFAESLASVSHP